VAKVRDAAAAPVLPQQARLPPNPNSAGKAGN
jgi:hypothetical protein